MLASVLQEKLPLLLRPIAWMAVRYSISLQEIVSALKRSLVSAAEGELQRRGDEPNASNVSVMTGVHRSDAKKLLLGDSLPQHNSNPISDVIGFWRGSKKYQTPAGKPRELEAEGKQSEFSELVRTVQSSLNPYTILNELIRLQLVKRKGTRVQLLRPAYVPRGKTRELVEFLADDSLDLTQTVAHNFSDSAPDKDLLHHLKTEYTRVPASASQEIHAWLRKRGAEVHQEISAYLAKYDRDITPRESENEEYVRIGFGSFAFENHKEN